MEHHAEPVDPAAGAAEDFDLAAFMRRFEKQMTALREQSGHLRPHIEATSLRVVSDGREIAVTVAVGGGLVDVEFLPAADGVTPAELGALVMRTHERAVAEIAERSDALIDRLFDEQAKALHLAEKLMQQAADMRAQGPAGARDRPGRGSAGQGAEKPR